MYHFLWSPSHTFGADHQGSGQKLWLCLEGGLQNLHLPWHLSNFTINRVADYNARSRGTVSFKVAGVWGGGNQIEVEAFVLSKVTADLPTFPQLPSGNTCQTWSLPTLITEFQQGWTSYLSNSSKVVLHGRRFSPTRAPSAFKTCFSWVLNEEVKGEGQQFVVSPLMTTPWGGSGRLRTTICRSQSSPQKRRLL